MNVSPDKIGPIMGNLLDGSSSVTDMKDVFGSLRCDWLEVDCPEELQVQSITHISWLEIFRASERHM